MPRYYRRRYRTIVRAPKKKWASNMVSISMTFQNSTQQAAAGFYPNILAQNKTEGNAPTPVILKTGNFKVQCDFTITGNTTQDLPVGQILFYIIFIPEGMVPLTPNEAAALVRSHPEWIMAWKLLDINPSNNTALYNGGSRFTLSSRLKRNLNSGDSVYALAVAEGLRPNYVVTIHGGAQFWTCAN